MTIVAGSTASGRKRIDQLPDGAAELVERLQPFQRDGSAERGTPEQDLLMLLQWLSNSDKHRVPAVVLVAPAEGSHGFRVEFESEEDAALNVPPDETYWAGPWVPGVVLVEHRATRPIARVEGEFEAEAVVALETPRGFRPASALLGDLGGYVSTVCGLFEGFFD